MSIRQSFQVVVPGSTSNLGPGFDSVGMALNRFLSLHVHPAKQLEVVIHGGDYLTITEGENLVLQVMKEAFRRVGRKMPGMRLEISGDIPLQRGLGSSGAAIIAGLVAANHLLDKVWSDKELLQMAVQLEGHPDNVGASLLGGVVIGSWDGKEIHVVQAPAPPLYVVAAIPEQFLSTEASRALLPEKIAHTDAVFSSSRANLLIAALLTKRWDLLRIGMEDRFHQPYRLSSVPGLEEMLQQAYEHGALGVALSGAGPTVISFTEDPAPLESYLEELFQKRKLSVEILRLRPWSQGATVQLTAATDGCKVIGNVQGDGTNERNSCLSGP